jgi:hypothetical protein
MVEAATRWPRRRSSPWILEYPHAGFSRARRRMRAVSSSEIGGRPDRTGFCLHYHRSSRRCQARRVPGGDQAVATQPAREVPGEGGEHSAVRPCQVRPCDELSSQYRDFVAQCEELNVLGILRP